MNKNELCYAAQYRRLPIGEVIIVEERSGAETYPKVCAFFVDTERDVFKVDFFSDGTIHFDTSSLSYFIVDSTLLGEISSVASDALILAEELDEFLDEETNKWTGYKHLITYPKPARFQQ